MERDGLHTVPSRVGDHAVVQQRAYVLAGHTIEDRAVLAPSSKLFTAQAATFLPKRGCWAGNPAEPLLTLAADKGSLPQVAAKPPLMRAFSTPVTEVR